MSNWIKVTDRLPEEFKEVLVFGMYPLLGARVWFRHGIGYYRGPKDPMRDWDYLYPREATAMLAMYWCPIPEMIPRDEIAADLDLFRQAMKSLGLSGLLARGGLGSVGNEG